MAPPSKFTAETREAVITAIESGATNDVAAAAAGVESRTIRKWRTRGGKAREAGNPDDPYAIFEGAYAEAFLRRARERRIDAAEKIANKIIAVFRHDLGADDLEKGLILRALKGIPPSVPALDQIRSARSCAMEDMSDG